MTRRRLDLELVRRGLAATREDATEAIEAGRVTVAGRPAARAETLVAPSEPLSLTPASAAHVSRGGRKLDPALDRLGIDAVGRHCLDAGASTGGFTDVLLGRGAARVIAVDVGYGQLAWKLRTDDRVTVLERTNVRELRREDLPFRPDLVTADLSFISLTSVLPALVSLCDPGAELVLLIKPQFEAAREQASGGVVEDPAVWRTAIERVARAAEEAGAGAIAVVPSELPGPAGNVEFFLHARVGAPSSELEIDAALREGAGLRRGTSEAS